MTPERKEVLGALAAPASPNLAVEAPSLIISIIHSMISTGTCGYRTSHVSFLTPTRRSHYVEVIAMGAAGDSTFFYSCRSPELLSRV